MATNFALGKELPYGLVVTEVLSFYGVTGEVVQVVERYGKSGYISATVEGNKVIGFNEKLGDAVLADFSSIE